MMLIRFTIIILDTTIEIIIIKVSIMIFIEKLMISGLLGQPGLFEYETLNMRCGKTRKYMIMKAFTSDCHYFYE